jgi:hypothetical protein
VKLKPFQWPKARPKTSLYGLQNRWPWSKRMFINHPDVSVVVNDAWEAMARVEVEGRSSAMLILGESGAGKTRLANEFKLHTEEVYGRKADDRSIVPAILLEVPEACTPREFCNAILRALGDFKPERRKGSLTGVVVGLLRACETRVIIIDNVQDIPTRRRSRGIEQVAVRLRELIDQSQCLWLLLGTSIATDVVDSESQLIKRVAYRKTLPYFSIATNSKRFLVMLNRIEEWLPLAQDNKEFLQGLAGKIAIATHGVLDRIEKLLNLACVRAVDDAREYLTEEDMKEGFRKLYGSDVPNPFAADFVTRRLTGVNEPFEKLAAPPKDPESKKSKWWRMIARDGKPHDGGAQRSAL